MKRALHLNHFVRPIQSWRAHVLNRDHPFAGSAEYWDRRYVSGGNSGAGSYGKLAAFKAGVLNGFVKVNNVSRVLELGCGDGAQLALADYPSYVGLDISPRAVELCRRQFIDDPTKSFIPYTTDGLTFGRSPLLAELSISLDVIYHLVEDDIWEKYLDDLFVSSSRWVIIYSSDTDEASCPTATALHVRHRPLVRSVTTRFSQWEYRSCVPNIFPGNGEGPDESSFANFYIFRRRKGA
jgi:SAM-dependent methyltransferase